MKKLDTLIVDKTGTLTEGKPAFDRIIAAPGSQETEVAAGGKPRPGK
jgi:Cu+-exporting ATPase